MIRACLIVLSLTLVSFAAPTVASAQAEPEAVSRLQILALRFRECLVRSATEQRKAGADKDKAIEQAFAACGAEENAIVALAEAQRVPPGRIKLSIDAIKQKMKQQIADDLP
jgi:hypothetical protein